MKRNLFSTRSTLKFVVQTILGGQVKRTANGTSVSQDQIDMIVAVVVGL